MLEAETSRFLALSKYDGQVIKRLCRYASSASNETTKAAVIRNIALMAHIDSGKTTLTESILHASSYISEPGSVDTGSTITDFLPTERERGITIQSASIPVKWQNWTFNLIDTPGHVDFGMEVESASRVVDGAVVLLDSVEGVEGQTKGVWRQLDRHKVPSRMIFMNKLDRPGASIQSSVRGILAHKLHPKPILLTLPISSFSSTRYETGEPGIEGVLDLVNWEVWKHADGETSRLPLPTSEKDLKNTTIFSPSHPLKSHILPARSALIDNLSLLSPSLFSSFDALPASPSPYLSLQSSVIMSSIRELTLRQEILPVLCGSALKNVGVELLMNYIGDLLASPIDVRPPGTGDGLHGRVQMLAWKVGWDKRRGWMTFVRVYQGTLTRQTVLLNANSGQTERVSKLVLLYASRHEEVDVLPFGSVGVILGLKHTRTGDTLVSSSWGSTKTKTAAESSLRSIIPPPAVMSASVIPQAQSDVKPVQGALLALARTDPSVRIAEEEEEGQTLVHGLGALHLEIVEGRLRDEWGVRCKFGKRQVSYRESFGGAEGELVSVNKRWEKDIGGKVVGAMISIEVRPVKKEEHDMVDEAWGGNVVVDATGARLPSPNATPEDDAKSPIFFIIQGFRTGLSSSPHTTLPLSRLHITLRSCALDLNAPPSILAVASTVALRQAIQEAGPGNVMEPFVRVKVDVGEESVGRVVRDLTENGGQILDLQSSSLSSGTGSMGDDILPYPEDDLYIPPAWLTPSSSALASTSGGLHLKRSVHAIAPLSKMLDYSSRLRAVSGGLGTFEMTNEGFKVVVEARKMEILREIGRA